MNFALSEALNLARRWQNASTEIRALIQIGSREIVVEFTGRVVVEAEGITITNVNSGECRIALLPTMAFAYSDGMLKINGGGWGCNLYEVKDPNIMRLV
jgi:hypothetical protein